MCLTFCWCSNQCNVKCTGFKIGCELGFAPLLMPNHRARYSHNVTADADHNEDFPGWDFSSAHVIWSGARGIKRMRKTSPLGFLLSLGYHFQKSNASAFFRSKCFLIWKSQLQDLSYSKKDKWLLIIKLLKNPYIYFFFHSSSSQCVLQIQIAWHLY